MILHFLETLGAQGWESGRNETQGHGGEAEAGS